VIRGIYQQPYSEFKQLVFDFQIIIQTAKKNLRPTIPETCPKPVKDLVSLCWDPVAENRYVDVVCRCLMIAVACRDSCVDPCLCSDLSVCVLDIF
jgi:hypothetical protein